VLCGSTSSSLSPERCWWSAIASKWMIAVHGMHLLVVFFAFLLSCSCLVNDGEKGHDTWAALIWAGFAIQNPDVLVDHQR
jgi:uncharacterized RDD family membrane protein YckC